MFGVSADMLVSQILQKEQELFPPLVKLDGCLGGFITGLDPRLRPNEHLVFFTSLLLFFPPKSYKSVPNLWIFHPGVLENTLVKLSLCLQIATGFTGG